MVSIDDPRLVFIPLDEVEKATGLCDIRDNYHCLYVPEKGVVLWQLDPKRRGTAKGASLMGNKMMSIAQSIQKHHYPWAEIKLIPRIIIPINPSDY